MKKFEDLSADDLKAWAWEFQTKLRAPTVIKLKGELGAGKTQFVSWCLRECEVTSPTFALHHEYTTHMGTVHHLDLYRVNSAEEFEGTGLAELFEADGSIVFVEWPADWLDSYISDSWRVETVSLSRGTKENLRNLLWS